LLASFHASVRRYHERLRRGWGLGLRGCCWAARFPGRNIEIEIPEMATAGRAGGMAYFEYLGPEVDAGFRVAPFARAGDVVVTLNLAAALAPLAGDAGLRFHGAGEAVLKGVHAGQPYPIIGLTCEGGPDPGDAPPAPGPALTAPDLAALVVRVRAGLARAGGLGLAELEF
jgi:hypothetical protein